MLRFLKLLNRNSPNKTAIFAILGILVLVGAGIAYRYARTASELSYELATARKGNLIQEISATGTVNAVVTLQVGSQVSGTVKEIFVDNNSPVKKGQLIAALDASAFEAQLVQAQANLNAAKALLEKVDVQLRDAKLNAKRMRNLFNAGAVSRSQLDAAETSLDSALADKKSQESQVAQFEASINLAKVNLDHTKIRSPIDGIVLSRNIEVGQTVTSSLQSPTLFVIATDITKMEVNTRVSETDIGNVKVSQKATFTVDAYPDKVFNGEVKEIRMVPNIAQNAVSYSVIISVDNKEILLRPGMTAEVRIKIAYKENVLLIPATAVKGKKGNKYVEVVDGKKIRIKDVKTGLKSTDGSIEILSGLTEGEQMVLSIKQK